MATNVWPGTLPQIALFDGAVKTLANVVVRTKMDQGPAKVRRRFQDGVTNWPQRMPLTDAQRVTFEAFFKATSEGGALPFDYPDPFDGSILDFRFVGQPTIEKMSVDLFVASFALEQLP